MQLALPVVFIECSWISRILEGAEKVRVLVTAAPSGRRCCFFDGLPQTAHGLNCSGGFNRMKTFGLTGGVGMGKSTAADALRARGVPVVDTDDIARELVQPGQSALREIECAFGAQVIGSNGQLLRDKLAQIVFKDDTARARLESILHPAIMNRWKEQVQTWRREGCSACVVVIPLLFETGAEGQFDAVVCVACTPQTQERRLTLRGWSLEEIRRRNAAQLPISQKVSKSRFVVWSEGDKSLLAEQLARIVSI